MHFYNFLQISNSKLKKITILIFLSCCSGRGNAGEYDFDPSFLSDNPEEVADLARFNKGLSAAPGSYHVDVYVNGTSVGARNINFYEKERVNAPSELNPCLDMEKLRDFNINIESLEKLIKNEVERHAKCVDIARYIPEANADFDVEHLRLDLKIPQMMMNRNARGYIPPSQWDEGIPAALLSYAFTGSNSRGDASKNDSYFLRLNSGLNVGPWRLYDQSSFTYSKSRNGDATRDWNHMQTYLQRAIIPWDSQLTVGDTYTSSEVFDSVSVRGVTLATDESMQPDSLRGFAPVIRGIANGDSQITLRQNGNVIYQSYVPSGPFEINDLYPTGSSGDIEVSVKEKNGNIRTYTVPFASVPKLQREGHLNYSIMAGRFRSTDGNQSEPYMTQASLLWGWRNGITLYGGSQVAERYLAFTAGAGKNLGFLGAISIDATQANSKIADGTRHSGQSFRFLYAKSLNELGTRFELLGYRYSTRGFYTLAETTRENMAGGVTHNSDGELDYSGYYNLYNNKRSRIQISLTQQLGHNYSVYASGSDQSYWNTDGKTRLLQLGFTGIVKDVSYNLNYSYNKNTWSSEADRVFNFTLSLPIGKWLSGNRASNSNLDSMKATYGLYNDGEGNMTNTAGLYGTMLADKNLSYNMQMGTVNRGNGSTGSLNLDYYGRYGQVNAGYSSSQDAHRVNYGVQGGMVLHQDGLTLSQPLGKTNVLVKAPGVKDAAIQNKTGVRTDWRGYTVVPYATNYRLNRIGLDVNSLAADSEIDNSVVSVVPTSGALVRAEFKTHIGQRALITLTNNGKPLPFGTTVVVVQEGEEESTGIVGDNGQVYLSGLQPSGLLEAVWGTSANSRCRIPYRLPETEAHQDIVYLKGRCN